MTDLFKPQLLGGTVPLKNVDVGSNKLIREQYPTLNVAMLESFKGQTPYELHV